MALTVVYLRTAEKSVEQWGGQVGDWFLSGRSHRATLINKITVTTSLARTLSFKISSFGQSGILATGGPVQIMRPAQRPGKRLRVVVLALRQLSG